MYSSGKMICCFLSVITFYISVKNENVKTNNKVHLNKDKLYNKTFSL